MSLQADPVRCAELRDWLTPTLRPTFWGRVLPITEDILVKWRMLLEPERKIGTHFHSRI
jgi:hypothetical protein